MKPVHNTKDAPTLSPTTNPKISRWAPSPQHPLFQVTGYIVIAWSTGGEYPIMQRMLTVTTDAGEP